MFKERVAMWPRVTTSVVWGMNRVTGTHQLTQNSEGVTKAQRWMCGFYERITFFFFFFFFLKLVKETSTRNQVHLYYRACMISYDTAHSPLSRIIFLKHANQTYNTTVCKFLSYLRGAVKVSLLLEYDPFSVNDSCPTFRYSMFILTSRIEI